ncbi:unnamed protein product [Bursaphelenchus xylophilus]|nr:unnamed protein product [Bursaphelenchus xylophilus]CAG9114674.1 unnamed protein product [Bursaphelenchus xylophilus]
MKKKAKDEAPEMFGVQHKCPYDVLLYASYITTLDLRTYRGPLVADDEARLEIKRMKGEEKAIKLWNETKEVMVRLAELIKEKNLDQLICNAHQLAELPTTLTATRLHVRGSYLSVQTRKDKVNAIIFDGGSLDEVLCISSGRKYDHIEKLLFTFSEGYMWYTISDVDKLQEYFPKLCKIKATANFGNRTEFPLLDDLMRTPFKRKMKIVLNALDDSKEQAIQATLSNISDWILRDPNITVEFRFIDSFEMIHRIEERFLTGFDTSVDAEHCTRIYAKDRLKVKVLDNQFYAHPVPFSP